METTDKKGNPITNYTCPDCGHVFWQKPQDKIRLQCPKCKAYRTYYSK